MEFINMHDSQLPKLGLGTWALRGENCRDAVLSALDIGYRHIDTAQMYRNEDYIGKALQQTDVSRDEIFLTTKIMQSNLHYDNVLSSFRRSLDQLQTEYVDLLLIHWPNPGVPITETINAMNTLQSEGLVSHIGVSNFSVQQTEEAIEASDTPILTNQVRYDPFHDKENMLEFCVNTDLMLTAYSPLAKGRATKNSILSGIGDKYDKSAAQVTLRWLTQQNNVSAIPKSGDPEHQRENFEIFDFQLTPEEMEKIFELHGGVMSRIRSVIGI